MYLEPSKTESKSPILGRQRYSIWNTIVSTTLARAVMSASRRIRLPVRALSISPAGDGRWKPSPGALRLAGELSPAAIHSLITMSPVGVTADRWAEGDYVVRYGRRTAQLARAVLDPDVELEVVLHSEDAPDLEAWRLLDLLVVPVLLGPSDQELVSAWVKALDAGTLRSPAAEATGLDRIRKSTDLQHLLGVHGRKLSDARSRIRKDDSDG